MLLTFLFGAPRAILYARVLAAICHLCPCQPLDAACDTHHHRAAHAITTVAAGERDPDEAAALLLGAGAHETGFHTEVEVGGGPAVSYFQVEVPPALRAAMLADPVAAAHVALRAARPCGGSMMAYAGGTCTCSGAAATCAHVAAVAAELHHYVARARTVLAAH